MHLVRITKKLKEYPGARIAEKELREYVSAPDYNEYYNLVVELVDNHIIAPVKSSGSNGMRPPLHKRYVVIKPECKYDDLIPEIRLLHSRLNIEGYLNEPEKFKNHRPWLLSLNYFLKNNAKTLEIPLSVNERSFQIFGKEKVLKEDRELTAVLNFNPGLREALNCYNTPEPFFIYNIRPWDTTGKYEPSFSKGDIPSFHGLPYTQRVCPLTLLKRELNVLIIENKDTWYTLRRIMSSCCSCIAGIDFDCLIYGEGKKISRKIDSLTEFDKSFFKGAKTNYYYFGDLDYEGTGIFHDLTCTNPKLQIMLMKPLYIAMLDASKNVKLPVTKENQNKKAGEWFISYFDTGHQSIIRNILESGSYIPQEILNNSDFIQMIGSTENVGKEHV